MPYFSDSSIKRQGSGEKGKRSQNSKYSHGKRSTDINQAQQKSQKVMQTENMEPPTEDGQPLR